MIVAAADLIVSRPTATDWLVEWGGSYLPRVYSSHRPRVAGSETPDAREFPGIGPGGVG